MSAPSSFKTEGWTITYPLGECPEVAFRHAAKALNFALNGDEMGLLGQELVLREMGFHFLSFDAEPEGQSFQVDFLMWAWIAKQFALVRTCGLAALKARICPGHAFANQMSAILEIEPEGSIQHRVIADLFAEYLRWMCEQHGADCLLENRSEAVEGPRGEAMLAHICGQVLSASEAAVLAAATPVPGTRQQQGMQRL